MSVLAVLLVAIGVADLTRSAVAQYARRDDPAAGSRAHRRGAEVGVVTLWALAAFSGLLSSGSGRFLVCVAMIVVIAWLVVSARALTRDRGQVLALSVFAAGVVVQLALSGWAPSADGLLGRWMEWARLPWSPEPERALLVLGLALVQLSTGNVIVRLVLISTGAMSATPISGQASEELKGGRLLGPLERLFILGLGLAGQVTAAAMVIAAKGLIRWPELRSHSRPDARGSTRSDIDTVTEYFLVGSFVSWLVALGGLVLAG